MVSEGNIFNASRKDLYGWDDQVPLMKVNNGPGHERAKLDDLLLMKNYLLRRFQTVILSHKKWSWHEIL